MMKHGTTREYELGYKDAMREARKGLRTLRFMEYAIAAMLGIVISLLLGNIAHAQGVETKVQVMITAEVSCNPENCPQPGDDIIILISATSSSEQEDPGLWSRMVKWIQKLFE